MSLKREVDTFINNKIINLAERTFGEEFAENVVTNRRDRRRLKVPLLPVGKTIAFVSDFRKIKISKERAAILNSRKVTLISEKQLKNPSLESVIFGTLKFPYPR